MSARAILSAIRSWWLLRPVSMQACSPNWSAQLGFLVFELNPSHATYSLSRLIRGLSVAAGRVARIVSMNLYTHTRAEKKKRKNHHHQMRREKEKKASMKLFRNAPRPRFVFFLLFPLFLSKWTGDHQAQAPASRARMHCCCMHWASGFFSPRHRA